MKLQQKPQVSGDENKRGEDTEEQGKMGPQAAGGQEVSGPQRRKHTPASFLSRRERPGLSEGHWVPLDGQRF